MLFARVLVGGLLLVAALAKLRDVPGFASTLVDLGLVSRRWARAGAFGVIAVEAAIAVAVAIPATAVVGLGFGAAMFAALAAVALYGASRPAPVPCRCFGATRTPLGREHAYRNAAVSLVALGALPLAGTGGGIDPGTALLAGFAALLAVAGVALMDEVKALLRR